MKWEINIEWKEWETRSKWENKRKGGKARQIEKWNEKEFNEWDR